MQHAAASLHSREKSTHQSLPVEGLVERSRRSPVPRLRKPMTTYGVPFGGVAIAVHVLGVVALALTLTWVLVYRGGIKLWPDNVGSAALFNAHPVIQVGGFIFIFSEALLAYKTFGGAKKSKKLIHLSLQAIAFLLALVGVYCAWRNHVVTGVDNFYSLHSWLGLTTLLFFFIQWVVGFVSFWTQSVGPSTRSSVLPWHVFFGLAIYALAICTATAGFLEKMTFLNVSAGVGHYASETLLVNSLALLVVLLGILTVFGAILPQKKDDTEYHAIE